MDPERAENEASEKLLIQILPVIKLLKTVLEPLIQAEDLKFEENNSILSIILTESDLI